MMPRKMSGLLYKLNGHIPVPCDNVFEWARSFKANRRVAKDTVEGWYVSTVFLGIDHGFGFNGPPVLFETMVFAPHLEPGSNFSMERYCTWDEAAAGHARILADLQRLLETSDATTSRILKALKEKH